MKNFNGNPGCFEPAPYVYILWCLNYLIFTKNVGIDLVDYLSLQPRNNCVSFILYIRGTATIKIHPLKSACYCHLQAEVVIVRV